MLFVKVGKTFFQSTAQNMFPIISKHGFVEQIAWQKKANFFCATMFGIKDF